MDTFFAAVQSPGTDEELAGEAAAVAAFSSVLSQARRRALRLRFGVAGVIGGLSLTTGLAAAGALPGAAQQVASDTLSHLGITVPAPNDHAGDHPSVRGQSADDHGGSSGADADADQSTTAEENTPDDTHGAEVSGVATTTDATGVDKGAEISTVASDGRSQAGADDHGKPEDAGKSAETPAPNEHAGDHPKP